MLNTFLDIWLWIFTSLPESSVVQALFIIICYYMLVMLTYIMVGVVTRD